MATPVGGLVLRDEPVELYPGRKTIKLKVKNTGDRPIQVGSHFHFFEANRHLEFDRPAAFGWHLAIPSGSAVRFEPGDEKEVTLVPYGGKRRAHGFNGLTNAWVGSRHSMVEAFERAKHFDYRSTAPLEVKPEEVPEAVPEAVPV